MDALFVRTVADVVLAVAAITGVVLAVVRYFNRRLEQKIVEEIRQATYPIHPESNGGKSLADLHRELARLHKKIDDIKGSDSA